MIKIEPDARPPHYEDHTFTIALIAIVVSMVLVGGFFYWYYMPKAKDYSSVYTQLGISHLPSSVERQPQIQSRLDQLSREPCYRDAIHAFANALLEAGYPRETDTSLASFTNRCGVSDRILVLRYEALSRASDFSAALRIANDLVKSDPAGAQVRYWRGGTFEELNDFEQALSDYINSVQLLGDPKTVAGRHFYDISRMYAALGRYCDAITPIETFIAFDPATRRTTQTTKLIAEYAEK